MLYVYMMHHYYVCMYHGCLEECWCPVDVCLLAAAVLLTRCLRVFSFLAGCDGSACQLWWLVLPAALTVQQPVIAGLVSACVSLLCVLSLLPVAILGQLYLPKEQHMA